jgi:hypothetical protein
MCTVAASRLFKTILAFGSFTSLGLLSAAEVTYIGPNGGSWGSPTVWSNGAIPSITDEVWIHTTGSADFRVKGNTSFTEPGFGGMVIDSEGEGWAILELSKSLTVGDYTVVGIYGKAAIEQTGGNQTFDTLRIASGEYGRYTLKKGNVTANTIFVGTSGAGEFEQMKGNVTVDDWLYIGDGAESVYTLAKGNLSVGNDTLVGVNGAAVFEQKGGTANLGRLNVGSYTVFEGTVRQSGGQMFTDAVNITSSTGWGSIEQSGGTHTVAGNVRLSGHALESAAGYTVTGGVLDIGGELLITPNSSRQSEFIHSGGKVSVSGGVAIFRGAYRLQNASLTTNGLTVAASGTFSAEGTRATIRTTGDVSFDAAASITTRNANLIVGKGSNVSLSAIQSDIGASSLGLSGQESWGSITLEKNVTLSLQNTTGTDAIYVNQLDIGSRNPFRVESIIVGNGVNMYYNADLRANKYLKGGTYDLLDGGQLIPVHRDSLVSTGIAAGLIKGSGTIVTTGTNTYGPGEVVGGSLSLAGSSFVLDLAGASDQLFALGDGNLLQLDRDSLSLFDFSAVDSSFTTAGTYVFVGGDWQIYGGAFQGTEASGTLSESQFSAPTMGTVPEPTSAVLTLLGAAALCARRRVRLNNRKRHVKHPGDYLDFS